MEEKKPLVKLENLALVLPMVTASLYLMGVSFNTGYLNTLGIDTSMYPLSVDMALYTGFFSFYDASIRRVLSVILAIFIIASLTLSYRYLEPKNWIGRLMNNFVITQEDEEGFKKFWGKTPFTKGQDFISKLFVVMVFVALSLFAVWLVSWLSKTSGQFYAHEFLKKAAKGEIHKVIVHAEGMSDMTGSSIICGAIYCSFLIDGQTVTLPYEKIQKVSAIKK